jgi:hypothetical protein
MSIRSARKNKGPGSLGASVVFGLAILYVFVWVVFEIMSIQTFY